MKQSIISKLVTIWYCELSVYPNNGCGLRMKRMKTSWPVQQWKQCSCLPLSSNNGTNIHMHAVCHFISREIIIPDHCISYWDKYKCNYSTFQRRVKSHPGLHFCCSTMLYGLLRKLVQPSESIKCKNETTLLSVAVGEGGGFQLLNYTVKNTE